MFYFVLIFLCLSYQLRKLPVFHSLILALTIFPALHYIVSLVGISFIYNKYLDLFSIFIFLSFILYKVFSWIKSEAKSEKDVFINLIIIIVPFICFSFLYHKTFLLPGHDPIWAPSLAKIIYNAKCFPSTLEPLSSQPLTYPPGYSIFLSIFYIFENPLLVLLIYKYINICVVSFTPALWAFYFKKAYRIDYVKSYIVLLCFYYGYFLIDRTLPLALAFAGKNAVLYSHMLFPSVFFMLIANNERKIDKIIIILSILGMILVHYSFLFMFSLLLFSHILVQFKKEKSIILSYLIIFICSLILFMPFYLGLKDSSFISLNMPDASLGKAFNFFRSSCFSIEAPNNSYFFWIFDCFGIQWYFKKLVILFCFIVPALYYLINRLFIKRSLPVSQKCILKIITGLAFSIAGALIMLCTLYIKPLFHPEYVRWFVYNFFAVLASVFLIYLFDLLTTAYKKNGYMAILLIFIIIPIFYLYYTRDCQIIYKMVNFQQVSYNEVKNTQQVLNNLSKDSECFLITESDRGTGMGWDLTMQRYKPLDYYYVISDCKVLNGSWITLPLKNSRELFNLPSQAFFVSTDFRPIFFIGKEETFNRYLGELKDISATKLNIKLGRNSIYKIVREFS